MSDTFMGRFCGWFWQGKAIGENQLRVAAKSHQQARLEQYAMTAAEAGDRALHPVTPLRSGSGEVVSALLHRESVLASLLAMGRSPDDLSEDDALRVPISRALPSSVSFARLCELLDSSSSADGLEANLRVRPDEAEALAVSARTLLDVARAPERQLQQALRRRLLRTGVALAFVSLLVVLGFQLGARVIQGPNLADGKPWRTSSTYKGFSPEQGVCDGNETAIFFHTQRESEPWVELDLGAPTTIERVDVGNRRDCCRDRSFPLAIEISLNGEDWEEIGRRVEPFTTWTLKVEPTSARYVRAKAIKRTFLHLESFEVR